MSDRKARRCAKVGHNWTMETRRGYFYRCSRGGFRCVADSAIQERQYCKRCGDAYEWETVDRHCIQSLSMDTPSHDRLRREGEVWV